MDTKLTPFEALQEATALAGGQSAIARICGVRQPSVWKWLQSSKRLPAEHVLKVEAETGVSRHLLRPDIYPFDHIASYPRAVSLSGDGRDRQSNRKPVFDQAGAPR
ncbi:MAG TPA: YdaS family helix-turn-helix protein [Sphingobium sp.]|nr:YdaS family helix-turn-helix protein [Sphingobium sp.]